MTYQDQCYKYASIFWQAYENNDLEKMKWVVGLGCKINASRAFLLSCLNGNFEMAQFIYFNLKVDDIIDLAFLYACAAGHLDIVKWLIDIHYKSSGFIYFESYHNFKLEIKELLIEANLVHPSQLNTADLEHYLTYTDGLVPADFDYPNTHK